MTDLSRFDAFVEVFAMVLVWKGITALHCTALHCVALDLILLLLINYFS